MGIFDKFRKQAPPPTKVFKRSYAAANTGRLFADFNASEGSADNELDQALVKLRNRSRDLARNNEYARRYLTLLKENVIGERGITLQVKAMTSDGRLDMPGNNMVEGAFKRWGRPKNCTLNQKQSWCDVQQHIIEGMARDGEVFIILHYSDLLRDGMAIEFIEPDQIDVTKTGRLPNGNECRMGVELDSRRRPVAYYMLQSHPGDSQYTASMTKEKHIRLDASRVIHIFKTLRAGQTRGEPWMAPVIPAMKQLGAFREAAIINARVGASKMGFFTTPGGDSFAADDFDGDVPIMQADPGTMHQLPKGVSFESFDPQYPSNEFDSFHKAVLKGIASGLGLSYTSLSNDLEATSYSSIRQGALAERDTYKNLQAFIIEHGLRPIYEAWLISAMRQGSFNLPPVRFDKFANASEFRGRAWSWVDPQKEMTAAVMGMKNGILSLQDVAAQYGKDTEELLAQIQKDKALMDQFGISYALEPYGAQFMPVTPEGADSE